MLGSLLWVVLSASAATATTDMPPTDYCLYLLTADQNLTDQIFSASPPMTPTLGLPQNHLLRPVLHQGSTELKAIEERFQALIPPMLPGVRSGGQVFMESDIGLTAWPWPEHVKWMQLAHSVLKNKQSAYQELIKILSTPDYCTPAFLPELCRQLRLSFQIMTDIISENKAPLPKNISYPDQNEFLRLNRIQITRNLTLVKRSAEQGILLFPWETVNFTAGKINDVHITPSQASRMLETFAREALLRHALFLGVDHQLHLVAETLDLQTRLLIAEHMDLVPLIPIYSVAPPAIDSHTPFTAGHFYPIAHREITWKGRTVPMAILADASSIVEEGLTIEFHVEDVPLNRRAFEVEIKSWLLDVAKTFRALRNLKDEAFQPHFNWVPGSQVFVVTSNKTDRNHFLLFSHYLAAITETNIDHTIP